mmetsp:Transcript_3192/g.13370  ORF Transcript_3192/g.13370 Transcript_3192/m.13370 type:complete len:242 (-) Transcript_3192:436-1161(-)
MASITRIISSFRVSTVRESACANGRPISASTRYLSSSITRCVAFPAALLTNARASSGRWWIAMRPNPSPCTRQSLYARNRPRSRDDPVITSLWLNRGFTFLKSATAVSCSALEAPPDRRAGDDGALDAVRRSPPVSPDVSPQPSAGSPSTKQTCVALTTPPGMDLSHGLGTSEEATWASPNGLARISVSSPPAISRANVYVHTSVCLSQRMLSGPMFVVKKVVPCGGGATMKWSHRSLRCA